jgi:hypothetical protein
MKKRLFTSVLSILMLVVLSIFGLAACGQTSNSGAKDAIELDVTAKELVVGDEFTLTATTTPADATVVWSTSNEAVATVDGGVVAAVSVGTATITAKNGDAEATALYSSAAYGENGNYIDDIINVAEAE